MYDALREAPVLPERLEITVPQRPQSLPLYIVLAAVSAAIFVADWLTPRGIAVWVLSVIPLGLTVPGHQPAAPIAGAVEDIPTRGTSL